MQRCFAAVGLLLILAFGGAAARADQARCEAFVNEDFSTLPEAATHLLAASWSAPAENQAGYCELNGYIAPSVGFGIRLPAKDDWNGRFIFRGCGGFCGAVWIERCSDAVERGYACIASDMGHKSTALDAKWAYNDRQAEIDFAFRATHVTAVAGKAITARYYGTASNYAYYQGCSTGGRQGMVAAQSFPEDFDGIIAGAPVINETGAGIQLVWNVQANLDKDGKPILKADDLPMIHSAAVNHCDANDGREDGIIDDPRNCDFDPVSLICGRGNRDACLTPAQVEVVNKIYQGPVDDQGESLHLGGLMRGSELNWTAYIGTEESPAVYDGFMGDLFRYMAYSEDPGPDWQLESLPFTQDRSAFGVMERLYTGTNPDLRRFKRRGGKLLVYHGWRDQSVIPFFSLDYHAIATRAMGGKQATEQFYRLFMIPGMNHCQGGPGPWEIDYLSAMEAWVERGEPPEKLVGRNTQGGAVVMQRDLYPHVSAP